MATGWGVIGCGVLSNVVIPNGILAATNTRLVGVYDIVA